LKIMVLDDDPVMLRILPIQLRNFGLREKGFTGIVTFDDGASALQRLRDEPHSIGLILCDLQMPRMDGVEFVRHLAEIRYAGLLVLLTGEDEQILSAVRDLALAQGLAVIGALRKPVYPDALQAVLGAINDVDRAPLAGRCQLALHGALLDRLPTAGVEAWYQPLISLRNGAILGFEALARWPDPEFGMVSPANLPAQLMTATGVERFTNEVLRQSLLQLAAWSAEGRAWTVSVNVAPSMFSDVALPDRIGDLAHGLAAPLDRLTLEVTEKEVMTQSGVQLETASRLRLKKVGLSVDDFGTGHSSLATLRDFPFSELKIDRSFVTGAATNPRLRIILEASLKMASELRVRTVAEGIESVDELLLARRYGCDVGQGFLFSPALSADAVAEWAMGWDPMRPDLRAVDWNSSATG
jgi:EAL domain-containing protein (putative c-di-GMP-specific phosphodiesterase class I)/ActR/RegA family two-component response regulator